MQIIFTTDGRRWAEYGTEPYVNKKGENVSLRLWKSTCAKCEQAIFCKTPPSIEGSKAFSLRHCSEHRRV